MRGRGSGGGARLTLASATRRASVTVSVRQIDGLLADSASKSCRPEAQHQAVAQRRDGRRAHAAGEEGDLADRLAGAQLGDRLRGGHRG